MNINKTKAGLFIFSVILQIANCLSLVLAGVAKEHPEASMASVQMVFSLMSLVGIPSMVFAGRMARVTTKKNLALFAGVFVACGGFIGAFLSKSMGMLYLASALIGFGASMLTPIASSLVAENFQGEERAAMMGIQALLINGGAIGLNLLAGFMGRNNWRHTYMIYFLIIPVMIAILFLLPKGIVERTEKGEKVKVLTPGLLILMLQAFLFGLGYMTFMTTISIYSSFLGFRNAGIFTSTCSLGCIITGLALPKVLKYLGNMSFPATMAMGAVGLFIISQNSTKPMLMIGSLILGLGFGFLIPAGFTMIPERVSPAAITMAMSLYMISFTGSSIVCPYVSSFGAQFLGGTVSARFLTAAIIVFTDLVIAFLLRNTGHTKNN
ncbi:MAG: MFS transporter [Solobacterium sp.]|nr:MFS transporter [Solobacterium sp.]